MFSQKSFYNFFLEKNPKMPQNNQQLNARIAEIYQMISFIQDLGDAVLYNPDIDGNTKCVFLAWYQMKLASIKDELDEISSVVIKD